MIVIKLLDGTVYKTNAISRRVEVANPTQMPIAFYIHFEFYKNKDKAGEKEIPYSAIAEITYE